MNKKMSKRQKDIKSKLMAAICMLLVSSIMMVSSTYAWFTLSTAPEVTGITTAVGANGNLEMALLPESGALTEITSAVGDSSSAANKDATTANVTWGNLVDLSDNTFYGLDKITLFPSALNITGDVLAASMLKTPVYGADGRVSNLAENTISGVYKDEAFNPNNYYGVRAIGTSSGMTKRQLDYRNARSAANTARSQAASAATAALNNNGSALANIAIKYGTQKANAEFTKQDLVPLRAIISALKADDGPLALIEKGYMQYILAYAASAATGTEDTAWTAIKGLVEADGATLESVQAGLAANNVTLPTEVTTMISNYNGMVDSVDTADGKLTALEGSSESKFTWAQVKETMTPLVDPDEMEINGFKAGELMDKLGELVSSVTSQGGLIVTMKTGAGVFATIADHTEDYNASVTIEKVEYNGIVLNNMNARMKTETAVKPTYLNQLGTIVEGAGQPAGAAAGTMPITDMYGYVIDLAFKTNAADSNLLLQQDAVDRIYSDNSNENTMGHGATMTFAATTTDFSNEQVKELMDYIRIVFFNPDDSKVIAYAKLDAKNATSGTDGWTAKIALYEPAEDGAKTYKQEDYVENSSKTYYTKSTETVDTYTVTNDPANAGVQLYTKAADSETYTEATYDAGATGVTYYIKNSTTKDVYTAVDAAAAAAAPAGTLYVEVEATEVLKTDNIIMPLTQNTATKLSVLVYLDGNKVTNGSVAATDATSMTGKMNLQFSSSATLVPMEYADLHTPTATEEAPEAGGEGA